jgi:hypothetical protein
MLSRACQSLAARIAAAVFASSVALMPAAMAQQSPCDSGILSIAGGGDPYADRGDRCEGTYEQTVAGGLDLQSVYQSFEDFDLTSSTDPLVIEWSAPAGKQVRLQADGRMGRESYRMDAVTTGDRRSFNWETTVMRALSSGSRDPFGREQLAVRAWADSSGVAMYLPIRIRQRQQPEPCGPVKMVLWAESRPDSVYVEVADVDSTGATRSKGRRELGLRPYPLNGYLTFDVPGIKRPGIYNVTVSARLGRERWSENYLIYLANDVRPSCS